MTELSTAAASSKIKSGGFWKWMVNDWISAQASNPIHALSFSLWDKSRSFWDIGSYTFPQAQGWVSERVNKWAAAAAAEGASRAEETNEWVVPANGRPKDPILTSELLVVPERSTPLLMLFWLSVDYMKLNFRSWCLASCQRWINGIRFGTFEDF